MTTLEIGNELISSAHEVLDEEVAYLSAVQKRLAVTSDARFVFPFSHSVVHGLFSGEHQECCLSRALRRQSCALAVGRSYGEKRGDVYDVVREIFEASYQVGEMFSGVKELRGDDRRLSAVSDEVGADLLLPIVEGISLHVENRGTFARGVWEQYASGNSPRLFNF